MKGNDPSHTGFARDPAKGEWETNPDRLVLEGLSGLEEAFGSDEEPDFDEMPRDADGSGPGGSDEEAFRDPSGSGGFRTAREMRAAQERFAAQQRSAARRGDGSATQGFDRDALESDPSEFRAPPVRQRPVQAKPLSPAAVPEPTRGEAEAASGVTSDVLPRRPGEVRPSPARSASLAEDERLSEESLPVSRRTERPSRPLPERPRRSVPASRAAAPPPDRQHVEADRVEHTRQRRERSAFLPIVITSALLTSVLWAGILWAFWSSFGQQWLEEEIDRKARSLTQALDAEVSSKLENVPSMTRVLELGSDYTLLDARFTNWVRLQALQASLWRTHSRAAYDDMVEAGKTLGSPEARAWFEATKRRTEDAYIQRIRNHPGLDIKTLFAGHRGKQETDLGKEDLLMLLLNEDAQALDRARAAHLLRRFEGEEDVVAALLGTASSGTNLHVVLAAWDSLAAMTDYVPPEQGFDRDHLLHWWNLRGEETDQ